MRFAVFIWTLACASLEINASFKVIREWNYLNFTWPSEETYSTAMSKGLYIPENNIVAGLKYYEDFYYISLPRMKTGVPATLTRIPADPNPKDTAPLLEPFPSWELNTLGDCNALQNVQNVEIDTKGQIWIIDGGRTDTLNGGTMSHCQPKLVVYDIKRNMTSLTYTFPANVAAGNGSFLYDIVVDNSDGGYAYITDNGGRDPGIIVFSVKDHHSWKIRHSQTMKADPTAASFRVNQEMISAPINIAGIALGPKIRRNPNSNHPNSNNPSFNNNNNEANLIVSEEREVYYAPLSSFHLYSINTSVLRNENFATNNGEYQGEVKDYGLKQSQSNTMIMDNQGVLYFNLLTSDSIVRWDTRTPFQSGQVIIARDDRFLEWPSSFTFDSNGNITILVNRLNRFIFGKLSIHEPNFRLITNHVGGNSYLHDENFNYNSVSTSTSSYDPKSPLTYRPLGNDRYPPSSTSEPKPEPGPTNMDSGNMDHDHMGHDHSGHDYMGNDLRQGKQVNQTMPAGSGRISATGFVTVLVAVVFLAV